MTISRLLYLQEDPYPRILHFPLSRPLSKQPGSPFILRGRSFPANGLPDPYDGALLTSTFLSFKKLICELDHNVDIGKRTKREGI